MSSFQNTSQYPDELVFALVRFALDQREIENVSVRVTSCRRSYRGRAWSSGRILVRIGPPERFPKLGQSYPRLKRAPKYDLHDWIEALVFVAAHEAHHIRQMRARARCSEIEADQMAIAALSVFREQREQVLAPARARVEAQVQQQTRRIAARTERIAAKKAAEPQLQIEKLRDRVRVWRMRQRRATTYLKKYERQLARATKANTGGPT